jgi:hypothetical protein
LYGSLNCQCQELIELVIFQIHCPTMACRPLLWSGLNQRRWLLCQQTSQGCSLYICQWWTRFTINHCSVILIPQYCFSINISCTIRWTIIVSGHDCWCVLRERNICLCYMLKICQVVGKNEKIRCEQLSGHYQNDNDEKLSLSWFIIKKKLGNEVTKIRQNYILDHSLCLTDFCMTSRFCKNKYWQEENTNISLHT